MKNLEHIYPYPWLLQVARPSFSLPLLPVVFSCCLIYLYLFLRIPPMKNFPLHPAFIWWLGHTFVFPQSAWATCLVHFFITGQLAQGDQVAKRILLWQLGQVNHRTLVCHKNIHLRPIIAQVGILTLNSQIVNNITRKKTKQPQPLANTPYITSYWERYSHVWCAKTWVKQRKFLALSQGLLNKGCHALWQVWCTQPDVYDNVQVLCPGNLPRPFLWMCPGALQLCQKRNTALIVLISFKYHLQQYMCPILL